MSEGFITASLAGDCYPAAAKAIPGHFRAFFDQPKGPAWEPSGPPAPAGELLGIIAPHIDYRVSKISYAWAYEPWLRAEPADHYLILGVGHHARQEWSLDARDYRTPLGEIEADRDSVAELAARVSPDLLRDRKAHEREHSIEFPLIALQALRQARGVTRPFTFVPLLCGGLDEALATRGKSGVDVLQHLGAALGAWWRERRGRVQIIVSIDGCHMGPRFQHPFAVDREIMAAAAAWEAELWARVEARDLPRFLGWLAPDRNARYFDGVGALSLLLLMFGGEEINLRRTFYQQWFEPRDASMVSFSSGSIRAGSRQPKVMQA